MPKLEAGDQGPDGRDQKSEAKGRKTELRALPVETEDGAVATRAEPPGEQNSWPSEAEEAAFLADQRAQGAAAPVQPTAAAGEETDSQPLPPLAELVQRIPAETRAVLDDLFRAKFTSVRRVPAKALKE